jgi:hypothetical protein
LGSGAPVARVEFLRCKLRTGSAVPKGIKEFSSRLPEDISAKRTSALASLKNLIYGRRV